MKELIDLACTVQAYVCQKGKTLPISQGKMLKDRPAELLGIDRRRIA